VPAVAHYDAHQTVKSAERVLRIFEIFYERQCPLGVSEIARALGTPQSSTSVLLRSLKTSGYLVYQDATRRYFPSLRLALVSGWIGQSHFPESRLYEVMRTLNERFRHLVTVSVRNDLCYEVLSALPARTALRFEMRPRELRPLSRTTIGHLLLSAHDDGYIGRLIRRTNSLEEDPALRVETAAVMAEIARIRAAGYAYSEGYAVPGVSVLAVAIPQPRPQPRIEETLALAMVGPVSLFREHLDEAVDAIRTLPRSLAQAA